ncbi:DUF4091 domain-containing protein [Paenibacillus thiaminolyticus]|uniref:DUF4091 domain-containing protein n=1 Tax=Paenibacillus thiaminolyticus TaxID=49283 RepID=A0AAP9J293_PANTH|nr:DUF4091 domain-containing protein [Paenibacillus thiaminolyticus]MCY9534395.1 DUF4091 domain-containing protein [Paenibacillus thiaminolyticus]MCY9602923.1 DUF4091 domain-containing protein [Paenibacillus thiaminolyticus]MCY9608337.1 DUF4091 domain-containing protein [Paenibacillus thiaminolyticus]MCY9614378.1 DUF4091 domain-containing protein [Paenibacillus thiaminolyticus]MCY9618167.1 DUF4091 domain-containing protein [Paenibacillus thiaminolyticus]
MYIGLKNMFHKEMRTWKGWSHYTQHEADGNSPHEIASCRRDSAAFQVLVADDQPFLLTTRPDALFWKGGALRIARIEVTAEGVHVQPEIKLVGFIEDDDGTPKADLLLEDAHIHVQARQVQPVWVEWHADEKMKPGTYEGKVRIYTHTLFEDEQLTGECDFRWTVLPERLPEPRDYRFFLDLWQHSSNIARKYHTGYWTEEHFSVLDGYLESMARLGQKALTVIVSEIPWSGQFSHNDREPSDLFEYSIVAVSRSADGVFHYDFSALNRYIALGEKHGICEEIEVFGLLNIWQEAESGYGSVVEGAPDGVRVRYYDEARGTYRFIREEQDLKAYVEALEQHFVTTGRIERVRILADEPAEYDLFNRRLTWLRDAAPSFRYKVAINHVEFVEKGLEGVSDYVPLFNCAVKEHQRLMDQRASIEGKLLYYVCCNPARPNTFLASPPLESRLIAWFAERLGTDGFLRWNYTVWPDKPLERIAYRSEIWKAGDTNFIYPGPLGKPLLSLRYKWLQRGIRDYELMQIMKAEGKSAQVQAALDRVFRYGDIQECDPELGASPEALYSLKAEDYDILLFQLATAPAQT